MKKKTREQYCTQLQAFKQICDYFAGREMIDCGYLVLVEGNMMK